MTVNAKVKPTYAPCSAEGVRQDRRFRRMLSALFLFLGLLVTGLGTRGLFPTDIRIQIALEYGAIATPLLAALALWLGPKCRTRMVGLVILTPLCFLLAMNLLFSSYWRNWRFERPTDYSPKLLQRIKLDNGYVSLYVMREGKFPALSVVREDPSSIGLNRGRELGGAWQANDGSIQLLDKNRILLSVKEHVDGQRIEVRRIEVPLLPLD